MVVQELGGELVRDVGLVETNGQQERVVLGTGGREKLNSSLRDLRRVVSLIQVICISRIFRKLIVDWSPVVIFMMTMRLMISMRMMMM